MSDYVPVYGPETIPSFTLTLSATVTAGQLVTWAGGVAGDASVSVAGVAGQGGVSGDLITVWGPGRHKLASSGSITQGAAVCAAAAGVLRAWVAGTDAVASYLGRASVAASGNVVTASLPIL
ncbi:MAG TPA: hypothetical protein VHZ96_26220 [Frankiaceae bacterium]|jgi:hypothetical protein|nr:hypothetical protein [Frankiaceae bacterium]